MRAVRERGLPGPADSAMVELDDIEASRCAAPRLTTVAPGKRDLAYLAVTAHIHRTAQPGAGPDESPILFAGHRPIVCMR
ncbi:hypothetical protein [Streptomyces sp. NPDC101776]|uniref:hypothetical protein n=1 Tax=Streptomyces sp. NPDC101776 TaxID=3366146 RepID=UPI00382AA86D